MADIFVSYARADKARVSPLVTALESQGWSIWWDPAIAPGEEFDAMIAAELDAARAVVVVWTDRSVDSRWVKGEAREAADRGVLVPVRFDNARLPIDVRAIHTIDLDGWNDDSDSEAFKSLCAALEAKLKPSPALAPVPPTAPAKRAGASICVLPFANMSGDAEQEYFSDGISEDIITDLSKVSALHVVSRNTAFSFKGKNVDLGQITRQLNVSHVLEGSVRKAGGRVRITAQLVDGASDGQIWAERYDRDLSDIFALQDEISQAIVAALKLKLLPEEKKAIEHRGTGNIEAYNLYLMARQYSVSGNLGDSRRSEAIIRLCRRATEIDPGYAQAWALIAIAQLNIRFYAGTHGDTGLEAAERALALDANLAEAHAAKAVVLIHENDIEGARRETGIALELDPESYEVNRAAARLAYFTRDYDAAIPLFEKAASLMETEYWSSGMVISAYKAKGDQEGAREAASRALARTERLIAQDPNNGSALGFAITSLVILGDAPRAKDLIERALLLDPDNTNMRYNLSCSLLQLGDVEGSLDLLEPLFETLSTELIQWSKADHDLDGVRDHPRFVAMTARAEARLPSP